MSHELPIAVRDSPVNRSTGVRGPATAKLGSAKLVRVRRTAMLCPDYGLKVDLQYKSNLTTQLI